jgi:hypothetical protein
MRTVIVTVTAITVATVIMIVIIVTPFPPGKNFHDPMPTGRGLAPDVMIVRFANSDPVEILTSFVRAGAQLSQTD